jgi:hypothetical protein
MSKQESEQKRNEDEQATWHLLDGILRAAQDGGLPAEEAERIQQRVAPFLEAASAEALAGVTDLIDFDAWNRGIEEDWVRHPETAPPGWPGPGA